MNRQVQFVSVFQLWSMGFRATTGKNPALMATQRSMNSMRGCYTFKSLRVFGARVHVHWSLAIGVAAIFALFRMHFLLALLAACCYYGVMLLHESGHAWFARRAGARPIQIRLTAIHGWCQFESPYYERDHILIAWGGVIAQLIVALPLLLVHVLVAGPLPQAANVVIAIFGLFSLAIAAFNLLPVPGLDGAIAWRIVPHVWRQMNWRGKARRSGAKVRRIK